MGIIDKCGVRGDATLCVVIFMFVSLLYSILYSQILTKGTGIQCNAKAKIKYMSFSGHLP